MHYTIIIHPAPEGGFWAEVPALPGCLTQGECVEETLDNANDAIEAHLQALRDSGRETPPDVDVMVVRVRVPLKKGESTIRF